MNSATLFEASSYRLSDLPPAKLTKELHCGLGRHHVLAKEESRGEKKMISLFLFFNLILHSESDNVMSQIQNWWSNPLFTLLSIK